MLSCCNFFFREGFWGEGLPLPGWL